MSASKMKTTGGDSDMDISDANFMSSLTGDLQEHIHQPHNKKLYSEIQNLKTFIQEFVQYQIDHPAIAAMPTWDERDLPGLKETAEEKQVRITMGRMSRKIKAQLAVIKPLHRNSVMKVREEKAQTAESRSVNDALILQTSNLKYEEQILRSEIHAAQNFPHVHKTLPIVSKEELFAHPNFASFNITEESSEYDIMAARIELEYQNRVKMEEARQEKLKQKQQLIAELKKRKEKLTNLDGMLEDFVEKAEPIQTVLDNDLRAAKMNEGKKRVSGKDDVLVMKDTVYGASAKTNLPIHPKAAMANSSERVAINRESVESGEIVE